MPSTALRFGAWTAWTDREALHGLSHPGVYAICFSRSSRRGESCDWHRDICYFGMTNSKGGLRSRLRQFDSTLNATPRHGGADRLRYVHRDYKAIVPHLYEAICPVNANVDALTPRDLRAMGSVAYLEFESLARYLARFGRLPELNQRSSPKFSSTKRLTERLH